MDDLNQLLYPTQQKQKNSLFDELKGQIAKEILGESNFEANKLSTFLKQIESSLIKKTLLHTGGNQRQAAKILGINRTTLVEKIKRIN